VLLLSALDPACPFGALLPWPSFEGMARPPSRSAGAQVVLYNGEPVAYLARGGRQLFVNLPKDGPERARVIGALLDKLASASKGLLIEEIGGVPAPSHPLERAFSQAGFASTSLGIQLRRRV
jgi:ATP-dependent helicase Lhr and Lhr-like helicase